MARGSNGGRRQPSSSPPSTRPAALLLLLLLLVPSLVALPTPAFGQEEQPQNTPDEEARGPLTGEGVDALVERFFSRVVAGPGGSGAATPPPPPPPLDPSVEALLSRLLDEVLPDGAPEALRARAAEAMGVPTPPPRLITTNSSTNNNNSTRRRRSLLQNATPLSPLIAPPSAFTIDRGGRLGGWAQAFQLVFTNIFDFFLRGGLGFLVPIIGDTLAPLRRYNWVRDVGMAIDAPFDNVINANYFPLPQTTDDLFALALRVLAPWCAAEKAVTGGQVLAALRGASAELELVPWSCDVVPVVVEDDDNKENNKNGDDGGGAKWAAVFENLLAQQKKERAVAGPRQRIAWETCAPSKLVLRLKPATFTGPYFPAATYTAAACAFSQPFGSGASLTLGLDSAAIGLRLSRVGVDVVPTITQFEASGRFFPWIAARIPNNATAPTKKVAFTSAANRTTGA